MNQFKNPGFRSFTMFPPMIKFLIISNLAIFILQSLFLENYRVGDIPLDHYFIKYFALLPFDMGSPLQTIWQLFTYQFMHATIGHIFFNMFALWMFGMELENRWGSVKFIVFYLLAGVGGGLIQLLFYGLTLSPGVISYTVGASGAVMGLLVAFGMTFPNRSIMMFPFFIPIKAKYFVMLMVGIDVFMGFGGAQSSTAHFAHLGGLLTGFLLLKFGDQLGIFRFFESKFGKSKNTEFKSSTPPPGGHAKVYQATSWAERREQTKPKDNSQSTPNSVSGWYMNGEEITQAKIDEILDKISKSGYQNLSEKEKKILNELSQKLK
jgi:rhomboid family protein